MDIKNLRIDELREVRDQSRYSAAECFRRACLYREYEQLSGQRTRPLTGVTIGSACVSGYMKTDEDVSPLAAGVSAGITLVFALAACYQKYKQIYYGWQCKKFRDFSVMASENTEVCNRQLRAYREAPSLSIVPNSNVSPVGHKNAEAEACGELVSYSSPLLRVIRND